MLFARSRTIFFALQVGILACLLGVSAAHAGTLTGSVSTTTSGVTISSYGTQDWSHFGYGGATGLDKKLAGTAIIPTYTPIGAGSISAVSSGLRSMSWSGGTPTSSATNTKTGIAMAGVGNGFRFSIPADAQDRTVRLYFGGAQSSAKFTAHLSDGSAVDYVNNVGFSTSYARQYTIAYRANGPGRTLEITWEMVSGTGYVAIFAAGAPTFTYVNYAPTLSAPSTVSLQLNQASFVPVTGSDINGDAITFSATGLPAGLSISPSTGVITGAPLAVGTYAASVKATDTGGLSSSVPVTFNVVNNSSNTPPSAASGSFSTSFETPVTVTPNWLDPDIGDSWTLVLESLPTNGTVAIVGQQFIYTPNAGYFGSDSFTFRVIDSYSASTVGVVSGSVQSIVPAQVTAVAATQGTVVGSVQLGWPAALNATSYRVFRGVSVSDPSPALLGTVPSVTFADNTALPGVQYYYSVQSLNATAAGSVSGAVSGFADTPPTAASATFAATLETVVEVFPGYSDPDAGDTPTYTILTQPSHGAASVMANRVYYTPSAGYVGADSFTFSVTDRAGAATTGTASGTVTALTPEPVTVVTATQGTLLGAVQVAWSAAANARNYTILRGTTPSDPAPVAVGTVASTSFSDVSASPGTVYYYSVQSVTIGQTAMPSSAVPGFADTPPSSASATFAATLETTLQVNPVYTDPDAGDTATFAILSQPANGSASVAANKIMYVPHPGYVGPDSFTFSLTDRAGAMTTGTATGTVTALTPAPVSGVVATQGTVIGAVQLSWTEAANARSYSVLRGNTPSDPSPAVVGSAPGTSYTDTTAAPGAQYYYSVQSLTIGQSAVPSTAVLGFADTPPTSASATFSTPVGVATTVVPSFADPDPAEIFSFSIVSAPLNGQVTVTGPTVTYRPNEGYVGPDSFTFRVTDKAGASTVGTATGSVYALLPDPVPGLSATKAAKIDAVDVNWSASLNSTTYSIYRSVDQFDPSPVLLDTISGLAYTDGTARAGDRFFYFVRGNNPYLSGPMSLGVLGFANTPPQLTAPTFNTLEGQPVLITPSWTDGDPAEVFTLAIITPPSKGATQIVSGQVRYTPVPGYVGGDTFQISLTDRAGASATAWATGLVEPGIPDSPRTLVVTQGTMLGAVRLDWQAMLGSLQYLVRRSVSASDPHPETIATITNAFFVDTNVTPGATYYYRIVAVGVSGNSAPSEEVSGYADTPPASAVASATTIFNTPVEFAPTVSDPDPLDSHTFTVMSQPANGSVVLTADQRRFVYTPTPGWSGQTTFPFTAVDVAGASIVGTATIAVGCPAPIVSALTVSQPKLFAGSGFKVSTSYSNTGCPASLSAEFQVLSGTTVVYANSQTGLVGVVSAPLEFAVDSLHAGNYVLKVVVTDPTTGSVSSSTLPLNIASYRMPTFTATGSAFADLDVATMAVGSSPDCQITDDRAAALADHRLCYFEVSPIPPGLVKVTASALPTWSGKVSTPAVYTPTLSVYQYDDFGAPKLLGSTTRTVQVQPVSSMTFASPAAVSVAQYIQEATITVKQTSGAPCQITTDRAAAITGTLLGTRMCFLEFATVSPYQTVLSTGLRSPFLTAGTSSVNWTMSAFDLAGNQLPFASGTTDVNVVPPDVAFAANAGATVPIATVTRASVRLSSTGSIDCGLTTNSTKANIAAGDRPCLVEWRAIPDGLAQSGDTDLPLVEGVFKSAGLQPVSFDVSYFDASGVKRLLWSASSPVSVEPPPMPEILLKAARLIGPDTYSVPVTGGQLGTLFVDTSKWPVDASVKWSDEPVERTYRINPLRGTQVIPATASPLWTRRQATIRLFLRDSPSLFVEKTVDVVSVPLTGAILDMDILPTTVPDNTPTPLTARVNMRSPVGPLYDADTLGQWSVQFGVKDLQGRFIPKGAPVVTDASGVATSTVDPFGETMVRVLAQATPISPFADIEVPGLVSPTRITSVVKGTPIDGTVVIKGLSEGPAPLVGIFRVAFATRSDQLANQTVVWFMSSDSGATWTKLDLTGLQIIQRLNEGKYLVKAGFLNRNTHLESETPPVSLAVWDVPKIKVSGPQFAFPGTPTHLTVGLTQSNGIPVAAGTVEWSVSRRTVVAPGQPLPAPIATGTSSVIEFAAAESGMYMVNVRARMNSANPDNVRAWGVGQYQVTYGAPEKPFNVISSPVRAEVGKSYPFDLQVRTRFPMESTDLKLAGRWTLPDGTVVPSLTTVSYTPTEADIAKGNFISIKHEVWVVGYEETTMATATKAVPIWKYVWPTWRLTTSVTTPVAPTTTRFVALPDNAALLPTLDELTYTWTVPPTMRTVSQPGSKLDAVVDYGGTHLVKVVVSDARGNSTPLESTISIADAKPYAIDLQVTNQSKWTHAPMQIGVSPKVSGGHPLDGIVEWKYFLNGTPLDLPNKNVVSVSLSAPGTYSVMARIVSRMGAEATQSITVVAPENQAPVCSILAAPTSNRLMATLQANCSDPDGAITKYQWTVNGVAQTFATGSKWSYVLPAGVSFPLTVDLMVTDDGSLQSTSSVTVR